MIDKLIEFETAKLAKEKGFILGIGWFGFNNKFYVSEGVQIGMLCDNHRGENPVACTQSLLQKWLREVHKINVESNYLPNIQKYSCLYIPMTGKANIKDLQYVSKLRFDTYEEALEVGLIEALKLIE